MIEGGPTGRAFVVKVFVAWLLGASVIAGVLHAWQAHAALEPFGAASRAAGIVAVATARVHAANIAATAALVAVVAGLHRRGEHGSAWATAWPFAVVPLTYAIALLVGLLVVVASTVGPGAGPGAQLIRIGELLVPGDLVRGVLRACASALLLGLGCWATGDTLASRRRRLLPKLLAAWLVAQLIFFAFDLAFEAAGPIHGHSQAGNCAAPETFAASAKGMASSASTRPCTSVTRRA